MSTGSTEFGEVLRKLRISAGALQSDVARILRLSEQYICDIEKGRRPPFSRERTLKVAKALDFHMADVDDLLIAWAKARGSFELPITAKDSDRRKACGSLLVRRWSHLTEAEIEKIGAIVDKWGWDNPKRKGKAKVGPQP